MDGGAPLATTRAVDPLPPLRYGALPCLWESR